MIQGYMVSSQKKGSIWFFKYYWLWKSQNKFYNIVSVPYRSVSLRCFLPYIVLLSYLKYLLKYYEKTCQKSVFLVHRIKIFLYFLSISFISQHVKSLDNTRKIYFNNMNNIKMLYLKHMSYLCEGLDVYCGKTECKLR